MNVFLSEASFLISKKQCIAKHSNLRYEKKNDCRLYTDKFSLQLLSTFEQISEKFGHLHDGLYNLSICCVFVVKFNHGKSVQ